MLLSSNNHQLVLFVTVLVVCLSRIRLITGQLLLGDNCTLTNNRAPGQCKLLINCPKALNDLRFNGIRPTVCGYQNLQQIVCCATVTATTTDTTQTESNSANDSLRERKCKKYAESVYETVSVMTFAEDSVTVNKSSDKCGYNAVPLIIGGTLAQAREFPHSALLGFTDVNGAVQWGCGGSLVSSRYIVTAGHCLDSQEHGEVSVVRLGELNINSNTDDATPIDIRVSTIIPHPDYTRSSRYNDIALLKLAQQVKLSPYIRPICLPTVSDPPAKAIATGWGVVDWLGSTSNTLLKVSLETFSNDECNQIYRFNNDRKLKNGIVSTQMCAGSRDQIRDTCQGDSGGPLQIYHPSVYCMYIQTGITSFGIGCGTVNIPGVYTKVYDYSDWIASIIWAPGEDE